MFRRRTSLAKLPGRAGDRPRPRIRPPARAGCRTRSRSSSTARTGRSRSATTAISSTRSELRDELVRDGLDLPDAAATPRSSCTSTRGRARARVEDAIVESISQVRGAFSLVMLTKDRLIARPRSARLPAARARPARRRLGRLLRDVRARSDWRDLRARRRAGRGASSSAPDGCGRSSRFRRRRSRTACSSTCTSRGRTATCSARASTRSAPSSAACSRARRRSTPTSSCRFPTPACARRSGYAEAVGHADADGPHPQPLRRPHVHPAAAVDPPLRRAA